MPRIKSIERVDDREFIRRKVLALAIIRDDLIARFGFGELDSTEAKLMRCTQGAIGNLSNAEALLWRKKKGLIE